MTKEINAEITNDLLDRYFTDDIKHLETIIDGIFQCGMKNMTNNTLVINGLKD